MKLLEDLMIHLVESLTSDLPSGPPDLRPDPVTSPPGLDLRSSHALEITVNIHKVK